MIRIVTARYLARLLRANERHQTAHANLVREIEGLRRQVDAAIERQGQLTAENGILRAELAEKPAPPASVRSLQLRVRELEDRARALDERLLVRQAANEAADRAAYTAAHGAVPR